MAENGGGGGGGGAGAMAAAARAAQLPRPTIVLPPRASFESIIRGIQPSFSPGPMTLVSSFFAEDPGIGCRSFSELLAGAMASPLAAAPPQGASEAADPAGDGSIGDEDGGAIVPRQCESPFFMIPPGFSPAGLLDSPGFLLSPGSFGMSHQQALAQVTAQAAIYHSEFHAQSDYPPFSAAKSDLMDEALGTTHTAIESSIVSLADKQTQVSVIIEKPAEDGYHWRKYGQKQVKGSEFPRSYYKCSHPGCLVKKKVERSISGQVIEIIYKGQHSHERPSSQNKRAAKEGGTAPKGTSAWDGNPDFPASFENCSQTQGNILNESAPVLATKRLRESDCGTPDRLSVSSDGEEAAEPEVKTDEGYDCEPDIKRSNMEAKAIEPISHKMVAEPRIIVQTTSEVDLLDDGYRWRKYGQKLVKGNPNPRSYYKCTFVGCGVRKHVERSSSDAKAVITTYEGKHDHDIPVGRNNSHSAAAAANAVVRRRSCDEEEGGLPPPIYQLKEESKIA